jgi:hypothetical protein
VLKYGASFLSGIFYSPTTHTDTDLVLFARRTNEIEPAEMELHYLLKVFNVQQSGMSGLLYQMNSDSRNNIRNALDRKDSSNAAHMPEDIKVRAPDTTTQEIPNILSQITLFYNRTSPRFLIDGIGLSDNVEYFMVKRAQLLDWEREAYRNAVLEQNSMNLDMGITVVVSALQGGVGTDLTTRQFRNTGYRTARDRHFLHCGRRGLRPVHFCAQTIRCSLEPNVLNIWDLTV